MSWKLAKSLKQLAVQLDTEFPNRTKPDWSLGDKSHSSRRSDHNPNALGVVRATDFRNGGGFDGRWLADRLTESRDPRVRYWIYEGQICFSRAYNGYKAWTAQPYTGRNKHMSHIHVSVERKRGLYNNNDVWKLGGFNMFDDFLCDATGHEIKNVARKLNKVLRGRITPIIIDGDPDSPELRDAIKTFNASYGSLKAYGDVLTVRAAILLGLR